MRHFGILGSAVAEFCSISAYYSGLRGQIIASHRGLSRTCTTFQYSTYVKLENVSRCLWELDTYTSTDRNYGYWEMALAVRMLEAMPFSRSGFARLHPGGAVGSQTRTKFQTLCDLYLNFLSLSVDATSMAKSSKTMSSKSSW